MPDWEVATALGIALLVALTTHVFYRRPPAQLWPALPLVFGSALIFSVGDLVAIDIHSDQIVQIARLVAQRMKVPGVVADLAARVFPPAQICLVLGRNHIQIVVAIHVEELTTVGSDLARSVQVAEAFPAVRSSLVLVDE